MRVLVPIPSLANAVARRGIKFHASVAALFTALVVPMLVLILAYGYHQNSQNLLALQNAGIERARDDSIAMATRLLEPVNSTLRLVAEVAASNPDYFRTEESRDLLYHALTSAEQIDAIYTSFEDGYHRVVTRIDEDRRRSDPQIPARANWHSSYIDKFAPGETTRTRHRTFFEAWPNVIAEYDHRTNIEIRTLPHYEAAKRTRALAIADPSINPDTGYPVMSLGYPIIANGEFIGFVGANITFGIVSRFLDSHKVSPNSTTFIIDRDGRIIAHPRPESAVRTTAFGKIDFANIADFGDPVVVRAARERAARKSDRVAFTSDADGRDYVALFSPFPASFGKAWQVITVAPVDDFVGELKATHRKIAALILFLIATGVVLIFIVAKRIARPLEAITREIGNVQALKFGGGTSRRSVIREIHDLQRAARLMGASLRSFSAFVPVGIIRQLIESGRPLMPSGESRFLTILFADLENFSTAAESLSPEDLVQQVSAYFETAAGAIAQEAGTIDKFIGDSVMAFWGAPNLVDDQVYRACRGAVRVAGRVARLNEDWDRDGRPRMRVRIGLHCADVVVGNVGSSDRLNYTAMGDGVNVASRLEGLNKIFNTTICISDSVHDAVAERIVARPLQLVSVKGRRNRFMVYELLGIRDAAEPELRADAAAERLCAMTAEAVRLSLSGHADAASARYREILDAFPDDPVARLMQGAAAAQ